MNPRFLNLFPAATLIAMGIQSASGQGRVFLNNHVGVIAHVYLPSPDHPGVLQIGNGPSDSPPGATDWTGFTPVSGDGFSAQLFAAPGADVPINSLAPALPITTFQSGIGAGFVKGVTATLTGVPSGIPVATVQMRVWDNMGGTIADWAAAQAQPAGTEILGMSAPIDLGPVPGPLSPPLMLSGLESFNLTYNVPEPSSFALAWLAVLVLWLFSRKKREPHTPTKARAVPTIL
jgi:hypothetical protein